MSAHYLDHFFNPESVALVGASDTPDSAGKRIMQNLVNGGFQGRILAVNPRHRQVAGHPCSASIRDLPTAPDLVVIAVATRHLKTVLKDCGKRGVHAALIIATGVNATRHASKQVDKAAMATARRYGIRIIGPDWVGLMRPTMRLNATASQAQVNRGHLALVSQSAAVTSAALDWASARRIGFSAVVSLGDTSDVDFGDVLDFLATDSATRSIVLHVETVGHARRFMSGLQAAARLKPVIVIKVGRNLESYRAASSHTGTLVGEDQAFDAALSRAGAVRVPTVGQLFASAELLAAGRRLAGERIAVITNGGGPGIITTDLLVDHGLQLAKLSPNTLKALNRCLPRQWPRANPVDILGDADANRYGQTLGLCLQDAGVDGVLIILSPQALAQPEASADTVIAACTRQAKPALACWMGGRLIRAGRERFTAGQFPNYATPENAVEALAALARYRNSQALLYQIPDEPQHQAEPNVAFARALVRQALDSGFNRLSPAQSKSVLKAFHIPVTPTLVACSAKQARIAANKLGLPVALKINAPAIVHKADIGCVRLNLLTLDAVENAWHAVMASVTRAYPDITSSGCSVEPMHSPQNGREVMLGVIRDPVFGPVISFGAGGSMVEAIQDSAVSLPPLNDFLARDLIRRTRVSHYLDVHAGTTSPILRALEQMLLRLSDLVCTMPDITDIDINPVIVDRHTHAAIAVDARMQIQPATVDQAYGHMAIMPYPTHLASTQTLRDGTIITLRPIRPEDAHMEAAFVRALSARSRYFRFMKQVNELSQTLLIRFTQIDYDREMAFVAIHHGGQGAQWVGVARYITNPDGVSCEFALAVADAWQGKGLGRLLMTTLMRTAADKGLQQIDGQVLSDNHAMLRLMKAMDFRRKRDPDDYSIVTVHRLLTGFQ